MVSGFADFAVFYITFACHKDTEISGGIAVSNSLMHFLILLVLFQNLLYRTDNFGLDRKELGMLDLPI